MPTFWFGKNEENKIRMLLNTSTVANSGNISYHLLVRLECPKMVGKFIKFGVNTEYDVVQLLVALDFDSI